MYLYYACVCSVCGSLQVADVEKLLAQIGDEEMSSDDMLQGE
jgi:hypothetical protein